MLNITKCQLAIASIFLISASAMAADCGPGPHWVDDCPPGLDITPIIAKVQIKIPCDNENPAPPVMLRGPLVIRREAGVPGIPAIPGTPGDITHVINYEAIFFKLVGQHGITVRAGRMLGVTASLGKITEYAANPMFAELKTDFLFKIDTPYGAFHTKDICTMAGLMDRVPPPISAVISVYEHPCVGMTEIPLFDEEDQKVGCVLTTGPYAE